MGWLKGGVVENEKESTPKDTALGFQCTNKKTQEAFDEYACDTPCDLLALKKVHGYLLVW